MRLSVFFPHKDLVKSINIEDGIEVIAERAFLECRNLKTVLIPATLTEIGREAFSGCCSLVSLMIPAGVTKIGSNAFEGCSSLTIQAPEGSYAIDYARENKIKYVETR